MVLSSIYCHADQRLNLLTLGRTLSGPATKTIFLQGSGGPRTTANCPGRGSSTPAGSSPSIDVILHPEHPCPCTHETHTRVCVHACHAHTHMHLHAQVYTRMRRYTHAHIRQANTQSHSRAHARASMHGDSDQQSLTMVVLPRE